MYPLLALCGENRRTAARRPKSDVEAEEDDVAVLHHILLALAAHEALSLAAAIVPQAIRSLNAMTSARMKPRSKSLWILPAACGAFVPFVIVHARTSGLPAVR